MPKPAKGARLGSGPAHQKLLIRGLAADLITLERIRTSEAKAKMLRPHAERLITLAKTNTLHSRRRALGVIEDANVVHKLFDELGPRFSERNGGYTRIVKLGPRKGDAAPMAIIELVDRGARRAGEDFVDEARERRSRGLFGRLRSRFGRGPDRAEEDDLLAGLDLEDVDEFEDDDEFDDELEDDLEDEPDRDREEAEVEEGEEAGEPETAESGPPPRDEPGPAKEPSAPDRRSAGAPVDTAPGGDAGGAEAAGKDSGSG